jgi:hypothetical protein
MEGFVNYHERYMTKESFERELKEKFIGKTVAYIVDVDVSLPSDRKALLIGTSLHFDEHMLEWKINYPNCVVYYTEEINDDIIDTVEDFIDKCFDKFYCSQFMYDVNIDMAKDILIAIVKMARNFPKQTNE